MAEVDFSGAILSFLGGRSPFFNRKYIFIPVSRLSSQLCYFTGVFLKILFLFGSLMPKLPQKKNQPLKCQRLEKNVFHKWLGMSYVSPHRYILFDQPPLKNLRPIRAASYYSHATCMCQKGSHICGKKSPSS